jgi:putative DNA methylase
MTEAAPVRRKLIEVALPLEAINVASAREKTIRQGHPSTFHLWWARRPLAACRAVLFASLVDDPSSDPDRFPTPKAVEDERTRLFGIIERLVQWENSTKEEVLEEARVEIRRSTGGNPPPILDPFCGGGSIPLEAQRLGLTAYASDLNPVAVLITKALVEIPPKFADQPPVHPGARRGIGGTGAWKGAAGLAADVRAYGVWMRDEAERQIGHLYPKVRLPREHGAGEATVVAWIWARTVRCPNPACGALTPLANNWELSTKRRHFSVQPVVDPAQRTIKYRIVPGPATTPPTVGRGGARCLVCSAGMSLDQVRAAGRNGDTGTDLIAVVVDGGTNRRYLEADIGVATAVTPAAHPDRPDELLSTHPQYMGTPRYGLTRVGDLFTERQLAVLGVLAALVSVASQKAEEDAVRAGDRDAKAYGLAIATYLALLVDRVANRSSTQSFWDPTGENVQQVFARQALPMIWISAEANVFSGASGSIDGQIDYLARALAAVPAAPDAHVEQQDATNASFREGALVSTDPPYYDNVPYADLSDFFYVWLRRSVGARYPGLFETLLTPKAAELVADSVRLGGRDQAKGFFEAGLSAVLSRLARVQTDQAPMTVYYAFRQSEAHADPEGHTVAASTGWETMLASLLGAGLAVVGTWPMRTEQPGGLRELGRNALASSVVLVCRPRQADAGTATRRSFVTSLKREMPEALRTLQHGNIAPVDLAQSSIGPGMAIFSRYTRVLEPDGSPMPVRTALALINQVLDEILAEQEGEFDADTRWAIAWYEQFGLSESSYGTAETLSKAKNSSIDGLVEAGIVSASRNRVRLLKRPEYSSTWDLMKDRRIPVWEATQRLIGILLTDGESAASDLLARLGGLGDTARDLAYRLYGIAERKGWTDEARAYNALVVAWTDLARGADSARAAQPTQANLGLE